jgi:hypothetical protein
MERRTPAVSAGVSSPDYGLTDPVFQVLDPVVEPGFELSVDFVEHRGGAKLLMCAIWARKRLRTSTSWARFEDNALRARNFSAGRFRTASGLKIKKRAMSSASILSVLARVPRLCANAFMDELQARADRRRHDLSPRHGEGLAPRPRPAARPVSTQRHLHRLSR